jgi:hypothetical protein
VTSGDDGKEQRVEVATMEWRGTEGPWIGEAIETTLWVATWLAILMGLRDEGGRRMVVEVRGRLRDLLPRTTGRPRRPLLRVAVIVAAVALAFPSLAAAGQGWRWGSPINPGFDKNTVVQVSGTANQVDIVPRSGPATLRLETSGESFTVMLGPGWYLAELKVDLRTGDLLMVEGSKMMDRGGNLHLIASRIVNKRTDVVLTLRDDAGRPLWMGGAGPGHMPH